MSALKRDDPIDEHEMKIICLAVDVAQQILDIIPYRKFNIKITEI